MIRRLALGTLFLSMVVIGLGYLSAFLPGGSPPFAAWAFALATAAAMVAVLVLGAAREGVRLGGLGWLFALLFGVLAVGFGVALALPAPSAASRLWLGLPAGAALMVYVVGLLPLVLLPVAYARTFERMTMSEAQLSVLRDRLAALRRAPAEGAAAPETGTHP